MRRAGCPRSRGPGRSWRAGDQWLDEDPVAAESARPPRSPPRSPAPSARGAGHLDPQADVEALLAKRRKHSVAMSPSMPVRIRSAYSSTVTRDAQPPPDAAELEADVAAPDHDQVIRHLGIGERLGARTHPVSVSCDPGKHHRHAPHRRVTPRSLEGHGPCRRSP